MPGESAERRNADGFGPRILRIDDGEHRALRILEHGVTSRALHVAGRLDDRAAGAHRRVRGAVDVTRADVLQPVRRHFRGQIGGDFHDARHRHIPRVADRVGGIERPGMRFPSHELRIEFFGAGHISRHQLVPDKSATHIDSFHGRISVECETAMIAPRRVELSYGVGGVFAAAFFG